MKPLLAAAAGLAFAAGAAGAQLPPLSVEVHGGIGITMVDHNKWSGYTDTNLSDWNTTNYQGYVQLLGHLKKMDVGLEYGYQYYWWYTYIYFITQRNYSTIGVNATHAHAVVRFPTGRRMSLELGAGGYFFDAGTDFGGHAALGYTIPVGPKLSIPLQLRMDAILDSEGGTMLPASLTAGLALKL